MLALLEGHSSQVTSAAFSPDGRRIATVSLDGTARQWDAKTGKEMSCFRGQDISAFSVSFSPDGQRIVIASSNNTVLVLDSATGPIFLKDHAHKVLDAAFSPDGRRIITGTEDGTAFVW